MCNSNISMCSKRCRIFSSVYVFFCGLNMGYGAIPIESKSNFDTSEKLTREETTQAQPPKWLRYPPQMRNVVYAIGSAETHYRRLAQAIKASKENASSEVLTSLIVTVPNENEIEARRRIEYGRMIFQPELRDVIRSEPRETDFRGVEIIAVHVDHAQRIVYTLAGIDREKISSELRDKLADVYAQLDKFLAVPKNLSTTQQLNTLLPSLLLLAYCEKLEEQLRLILGRAVVVSPQQNSLNKRINHLLDSLTIVLHPKGRSSKKLEPHLTQYLTKMGLRISARGPADLLLEYRLNTRTVNDSDINFVYARGSIVIRNELGRIINSFDAQAKEGSPISEYIAREKVINQIGEQIGEALRDGLLTRL